MPTQNPRNEIIIMSAATLIAGMAGIFYVLQTEKANLYQRISGPGTNVLGADFAAYLSLKWLVDESKNSSAKWKIPLFTLASLLFYAPQILITAFDPPKNQALGSTIFFSVATGLAGIGLNLFSETNLVAAVKMGGFNLHEKLGFYLNKLSGNISNEAQEHYDFKQTVLDNLRITLERMKFAPLSLTTENEISFSSEEGISDLLSTAKQFSEKLKRSHYSEWPITKDLMLFTSRILATAFMLYSALSYTCGTAKAAQQTPFNLSQDDAIPATLAFLIPFYVLFVIAGTALGTTLVEAPRLCLSYGTLSNEFKTGGSILKAIKYLSFALGAGISFGSSFTAVNILTQSCPATYFNNWRVLPHDTEAVTYGVDFMNTVFAVKSILLISQWVISTFGTSGDRVRDRNYLLLVDAFQKFIDQVKLTPYQELRAKHPELQNAGWNNPHMFRPAIRDDGSETESLATRHDGPTESDPLLNV